MVGVEQYSSTVIHISKTLHIDHQWWLLLHSTIYCFFVGSQLLSSSHPHEQKTHAIQTLTRNHTHNFNFMANCAISKLFFGLNIVLIKKHLKMLLKMNTFCNVFRQLPYNGLCTQIWKWFQPLHDTSLHLSHQE